MNDRVAKYASLLAIAAGDISSASARIEAATVAAEQARLGLAEARERYDAALHSLRNALQTAPPATDAEARTRLEALAATSKRKTAAKS